MRLPLAAITDEFSPDLEIALPAIAEAGITAVELRVVNHKNVIDLSDEEFDRAVERIRSFGLGVLGIASPVLKCVLPGGPPVDARIQQDMFGARFTAGDQPRLAARAFALATRAGASLVRVFSYWRTVDPDACFDRVAAALNALAVEAADAGVVLGLENEHACNIATGRETARLLAAVDHPSCQVIWDPANALVAGERAFPDGYRQLPIDRVVHVHAKDCRIANGRVVWGPVGSLDVGWVSQIDALVEDGYAGAISLETHWTGPSGDTVEASTIAAAALRRLLSTRPASA
jgi:L-ribulose-5-phosphate 3-epimerase